MLSVDLGCKKFSQWNSALSDVTVQVFFIFWVAIVPSFAATNCMFRYYCLYYIIFSALHFQGKWPISPVQIDNTNYKTNTFCVHNTPSQTLFTWLVLFKAALTSLRMLQLFFWVSNSKLNIITLEKGTTVFIQLKINIAETCIWVIQNFNPPKTVLSLYVHIWFRGNFKWPFKNLQSSTQFWMLQQNKSRWNEKDSKSIVS